MKINLCLITALFYYTSSCGSDNIYSSFENKDPAVTAARALEKEKPDEAIAIILEALGSSYKNIFDAIDTESNLEDATAALQAELQKLNAAGAPDNANNLVSILSSAQAQKFGADPFGIALVLAAGGGEESSTEGSNDANTLALLFPVLPESTTENIRGIEIALTVLNSIDSNEITTEDSFKKAIFLTSSLSIVVKGLDSNGDGEISALEAINLSDEAAASLLVQIAAAASVVPTDGTAGDNSQTSAEAISKIQDKIDEQEGSTQEEKLRNYLGTEEVTE